MTSTSSGAVCSSSSSGVGSGWWPFSTGSALSSSARSLAESGAGSSARSGLASSLGRAGAPPGKKRWAYQARPEPVARCSQPARRSSSQSASRRDSAGSLCGAVVSVAGQGKRPERATTRIPSSTRRIAEPGEAHTIDLADPRRPRSRRRRRSRDVGRRPVPLREKSRFSGTLLNQDDPLPTP